MLKKLFLMLLLIASCTSNQENIQDTVVKTEQGKQEKVKNTTTTVVQSDSEEIADTLLTKAKPEYLNKHLQTFEFENCKDFSGSDLNVVCEDSAQIINSFKFENEVVDIVKFNSQFYVVLKRGLIYRLDLKTGDKEMFINYENKVSFIGEGGLLGVAFSELTNEFIVSYVNTAGYLVFELNQYDKNLDSVSSTVELLKLRNYSRVHFSGNVIWSNYFNDFLIGIGDFAGNADNPSLNSNPQDTSSYLGKILLLRKNVNYNKILLTTSAELNEPLNNIVAYGFRNPWKFFEVSETLYIFDVGLADYEELNILKYSKTPGNFGWPYFEGIFRSQDINEIENYSLNLNFEINTQYNSFNEYIEYENTLPEVFYKHKVNSSVFRTAIIGGDLIRDPNSLFNLNIIFADFLSNEIFAYDLTSGSLSIIPTKNIEGTTSIKYLDNGRILLTTTSGFVHIIELPKTKN